MLSRKTQNSTYPACQKYRFKSFRAALSGILAHWAYTRRLNPLQHTESIQIVDQIPQPNLRLRPDQPNRSDDQVPRPHRLHPKNMFHPTPNPGSRPIPFLLSLRQLLMLTPLPLKMLPKSTPPPNASSFSSERYAESAHTSRLLLSSSKSNSKT